MYTQNFLKLSCQKKRGKIGTWCRCGYEYFEQINYKLMAFKEKKGTANKIRKLKKKFFFFNSPNSLNIFLP